MAGLLDFLAAFGKKQIQEMGDSLTRAIVAWDPETATEAEIEEMIKELDKITVEAGKAKADFEKEQKEAEAVRRNYERHLQAAEMINGQMEAAEKGGDLVKASDLQSSLGRLLDDLEALKPELEREEQEAREAKDFYDEIMVLAKTSADKVKQARKILENAQNAMKRAEMEKRRAADRAAKAEKLAGLRKDTGGMGIALASMNKQMESAKAQAAASDLKAKLLAPDQTNRDENILAALKQAGSSAPGLTLSSNVSERLAALRKK
ncbi:MAG: hypothetical protein AB7V04_06405 [Desulfomonilaceae bacterium]